MKKKEYTYSGEKKHKAHWYRFADNYLASPEIKKSRAEKIACLNRFDEACFTDVHPKVFLSRQGCDKLEDYNKLRDDLMKFAENATVISEDKKSKPLLKKIWKNLIHKWLLLEQENELQPLGNKEEPKNTKNWHAHEKLFGSMEGGIIAHTLWGFSARLRYKTLGKICSKYELPGDIVESEIYQRFKLCLYRYDAPMDIQFITYLIGDIKWLGKNIKRKNTIDARTVSYHSGAKNDESYNKLCNLADDKKESMDSIVEQEDARMRLNILKPNQRRVIEMRFGLGNEDYAHTFGEIGRRINRSKARAEQLYKKGIKNLRATASGDYFASAPTMEQNSFDTMDVSLDDVSYAPDLSIVPDTPSTPKIDLQALLAKLYTQLSERIGCTQFDANVLASHIIGSADPHYAHRQRHLAEIIRNTCQRDRSRGLKTFNDVAQIIAQFAFPSPDEETLKKGLVRVLTHNGSLPALLSNPDVRALRDHLFPNGIEPTHHVSTRSIA